MIALRIHSFLVKNLCEKLPDFVLLNFDNFPFFLCCETCLKSHCLLRQIFKLAIHFTSLFKNLNNSPLTQTDRNVSSCRRPSPLAITMHFIFIQLKTTRYCFSIFVFSHDTSSTIYFVDLFSHFLSLLQHKSRGILEELHGLCIRHYEIFLRL